MNILLVEDDAGIGRFVQRGLAAEGYCVTWLREAADVETTLREGDFAAMILDLGLPDRDGLTLCRMLRAGGVRTPIVMLTARAMLQDRLDGFDSGADDYLPKPFAFDELLARLAALIRRSGGTRSTIRFGPLQLDPALREVLVGDILLPLSRREYDVLAVLVAARGAIVPRDRLLAQVWGNEADVSDNVIDVYVGYLRRELRRLPHAPIVETLRGRGFRLTVVSSEGLS